VNDSIACENIGLFDLFIFVVRMIKEMQPRNSGYTDDILKLGRRDTWNSSGFGTCFPASFHTYQLSANNSQPLLTLRWIWDSHGGDYEQ
jgi:hypothetical protein